MGKEYYQSRMASSDLPVQWFHFFVKVRIPLGLAAFFVSIVQIMMKSELYFGEGLATSTMVVLLFGAMDFALAAWTWREATKLTPRGYMLLRILLFVETANYAVNWGWDNWGKAVLLGLLFCLIWLCPNSIYFSKRKYLFYPEETPEITEAEAV